VVSINSDCNVLSNLREIHVSSSEKEVDKLNKLMSLSHQLCFIVETEMARKRKILSK
jgi:hypothetical protein